LPPTLGVMQQAISNDYVDLVQLPTLLQQVRVVLSCGPLPLSHYAFSWYILATSPHVLASA
jgi:hypothetical protein